MSQQSLAELEEEIRQFFENYTQTHQHLTAIEMSLDPQIKYYRDIKNSIDYARASGRKQGIEERITEEKLKRIQEGIELGKQEDKVEEKMTIVRNMLSQGLDVALITQITGLSVERVNALRSVS